MAHRLAAAVLPLALALTACGDEPEGELHTFVVSPIQVPCTGEGSFLCLQVAIDGGDSEYFYGGIEGFDFVWGRETTLEVRVVPIAEPLADGPSSEYFVENVINTEFDAVDGPFDLTFGEQPPGVEPWFVESATAGRVTMIDTEIECGDLCDDLLAAAEGGAVVTFELNNDDAAPLRATAIVVAP